MSDLKVSTYIITSITADPTEIDCDTSDNICLDLQNCMLFHISIKSSLTNLKLLNTDNPCTPSKASSRKLSNTMTISKQFQPSLRYCKGFRAIIFRKASAANIPVKT